MRLAHLALGLILLAGTLSAQPAIEDRHVYEGSSPTVLRILSTADLSVFDPYLAAFHRANPAIGIDYSVVSSADLARMIRKGAAYDLALSSAMDLQFKLANDGHARRYRSEATQALPGWAGWRDLIFAFTAEPAVIVIAQDALAGLEIPATRRDLITLLREHPGRFRGRIGTYDVRKSGLGYLFATQDARATDAYWRLSEVMGRLDPELYCCSAQMIDALVEGELVLAYNVLGSYARDRLAASASDALAVVEMEDFANVMLRTAIIPRQADAPELAGAFIDHLIGIGLRSAAGSWPLPALSGIDAAQAAGFGPIRLGPGLMVNLDRLNRRNFLRAWENAVRQGADAPAGAAPAARENSAPPRK
ncbi:ABC transporter substrate-binding protein [Profundibacterium mesophilum]|uniref:ABC transporter substrate binding protein n=1 Tax=Profundibacterium mesophilum KAUST100406-0324 TaxID=1037889 RepID=A0A921NWX3_9RHOB|nr:substrate-binding domain-containing protein [Profundibacterium mesophilum]KAF0677178.1 ABC transporter substrate binding protein [Profundibacterium mesophilum KAUST100406-0324]